MSQTTEVLHKITLQNSSSISGNTTTVRNIGNVENSIFDYNPRTHNLLTTNIAIDGAPMNSRRFKTAAARSAFFSTPMISSSKPIVTKPLVVPNSLTPSSSTPSTFGLTASSTPKSSIVISRDVPRTTVTSQPAFNFKNVNEQMKDKLVVKVVKSKNFFDTNTKVPTYKTRSKNRGKLLLINNIKFVKEKNTRRGAEFDEENLEQLFKQMKFEIVKYRNLSKKVWNSKNIGRVLMPSEQIELPLAEKDEIVIVDLFPKEPLCCLIMFFAEMQEKIVSFRSSSSLKKFDMTTVVVMSHGSGNERSDSTEVCCTDGQVLETTWIINQFDATQCPQLSGKPKIFIFQCCRGDNKDIEHDAIPISVTPRKLSDMLIAYSTVPGFVSHRNPETGSWYIQAICKVFMEHAHDTDVENLLKIVDHTLSCIIYDGSKQTSSFENRGFRTCYLHPQLHE